MRTAPGSGVGAEQQGSFLGMGHNNCTVSNWTISISLYNWADSNYFIGLLTFLLD